VQIRSVPITHPDAAALVAEVQAEYVVRYGGQDESPIDVDEFTGDRGAFFVGYVDGVPVATGAWRRVAVEVLGPGATAEVKRMYVVPRMQRRGLARQMLAHLERTALDAGIDVLVLETGTRQPEAIALYSSAGYTAVTGFGHYRDEPISRSYARRLVDRRQVDWDVEAAVFDDQPDHGLADPSTRAAWRDLLLEVLPAAPARVVDLGCGTGTLTVLLAADGYDVTGLDSSPAMLERARDKARDAGVQVDLVLGDAGRPVLPGGTFDVVLVRHVLWAMADPADALRRWAGLLRGTGVIVLVEGVWRTGAGITASRVLELVHGTGRDAEVRPLPEAVYWGGPTGDERYLVVSH
jgi:SAM-dependent methyltransferase/GNAT superfamily N-acetyltransferase